MQNSTGDKRDKRGYLPSASPHSHPLCAILYSENTYSTVSGECIVPADCARYNTTVWGLLVVVLASVGE